MADRGGFRAGSHDPERGRGRGRGNRDISHNKPYFQQRYGNTRGEVNAHLTERFRGRTKRSGFNQEILNDDSRGHQPVVNPDIARYVLTQEQITAQADPEDWLAIAEIPPPSEICLAEGAAITLPRNKIDQPWSKNERYLKAHYKLLREDATSPLREAVERFRKDPQRMDDNETRIYEQVRIVGLTFTYKGIASRIRFSTARSGRKILWSASKRLTSGTLVALTPTNDAFKSKCLLAIVAARPLQNLEAVETDAPEVDIFFASNIDHEVDPQNTYTMVEAAQGYFEAYRHTLRALQKQAKEAFPLAEHICQLNLQVPPPDYVKEQPERNITPAADDDTQDAFRQVDILKNWPASPSTKLDPTQWLAMRDILTKRVAIIQGPPGTGKTHVSKIAINILLQNRSSDDPPIIVACQTNHALDQLLLFIREFETNFIRLGGRSTSAVIKQRALHEVRKRESIDDVQGSCFLKARRAIATETMRLKSILSPVRDDLPGPITAQMLFDLGIIDQRQHDSLVRGANQWVRADNSVEEPLQMWLGKSVVPFVPVYAQDNFGFEEAEEDLELEQRKELDEEMGVADEEDAEMLRGEFISLAMGYTMPKPSAQSIQLAKRALESSGDLYKVPEYLKGPMYLVMQEKARTIVRHRLRDAAKEYAKATTQIQIGRWEKDIVYLSKAPIIGMTTTGLSKYRAVLSALKPKVILIEEAAEVLEAPIGVACVESLQHLILVGDHQQLQAHCSVRELEGEPYHLNISMFERLVRNRIPHKTLLQQRRMDPEFRELIQPIYPKLQDHESLFTRNTTQWGMGNKTHWFFKHDKHELQDESMSTFNEFEAQMVAKFYRHLMRNGVPAAAITVLTFYNGQRKKILKALKSDRETASVYNSVKTVDSFQGEENLIVILSLVRSNYAGKIGFLDINNRNVVALSRAKYGFYLFGNGDFLANQNEVWDYVETRMHQKNLSQEKLPLTCTNHGNVVWVKDPGEFDQLHGGCTQPCGGRLNCGHPCPLRCHPTSHDWINCERPCDKALVCGHFCQKQCKDLCACTCEAFVECQQEAGDGPLSDTTPQYHEFAKDGSTKENVSQLPGGKRDVRLQQLIDAVEEAKPPRQDPGPSQEPKGEKANGRLRYEQHYEPALKPPRQEPGPSQEPTQEKANGRIRYKEHYEPALKPPRQDPGPSQKPTQGKANGKIRYEEHYEPALKPPIQALSQLQITSDPQSPRETLLKGKQPEKAQGQPEGPPACGFEGTFEQTEAKGKTEEQVREHKTERNGVAWNEEPVPVQDILSKWLEPEELEWEAQQRKEIEQMGTECW